MRKGDRRKTCCRRERPGFNNLHRQWGGADEGLNGEECGPSLKLQWKSMLTFSKEDGAFH